MRKQSYDFEYHLPNDVTLHCTADIYPGTLPIIYGDNPDPGSADKAEITEALIEAENGQTVNFIPDGMYFRPYRSTKLELITDHMEQTAIDSWRDL